MIAALFVDRRGPYWNRPDVDAWDLDRDARDYAGPHPVVAHPPCERWGRYHSGGPSAKERRMLGDDGGCFWAALMAVRKWGGVLEHPEASGAWWMFGLKPPSVGGGWSLADGEMGSPLGWTCRVEQGAYGHRARKATWLYAVDTELVRMTWRATGNFARVREDMTKAERARAIKTGACPRLSKLQRTKTPVPFAELLISIAQTVPWVKAQRAA